MNEQAQLDRSAALRVSTQIIVTVSLSIFLSLIAWKMESKSIANLTWLFLAPLIIAFRCNAGTARTKMAVLLPVASFIGVGVAATLIGYP